MGYDHHQRCRMGTFCKSYGHHLSQTSIQPRQCGDLAKESKCWSSTGGRCLSCVSIQAKTAAAPFSGIPVQKSHVYLSCVLFSFPPDIGQGINAGLNDVVALDRCLKGQDIVSGEPAKSGIPPTLSEGLDRYQTNRKKEHRALIRLARYGAPYQYKQSWPRDRVGATLWMWNAAFRQILNKITFGIVPPVAIVSTFKTPPEGVLYTPYSDIMRKADATTAILKGSVLFGIIWTICKRLALL